MQYVIDFTGFGDTTGKYTLKEYCIVPLLNCEVGKHEADIVKPPYSFLKLSKFSKKNYFQSFHLECGIKWEDGNISETDARKSIISKLTSAEIIYLKDSENLKALLNLTEHLIDPNKVVGLNEYGLEFKENVMTSLCAWHRDPSNNKCAVLNALICAYWLSEIFSSKTYEHLVESSRNKTAGKLMKIGSSDVIGQDEAFKHSDDSEGYQRIVINLDVIKKKLESAINNKGLDSSNMEVDSPKFVDVHRDTLESESTDVDSDSDTEDSMPLSEVKKLFELYRNKENHRKPVDSWEILSDNGMKKRLRRSIQNDSQIDYQKTKKEADVGLESTFGRNSMFRDEKLQSKRAIGKPKKLNDSLIRKRYKLLKRLYLAELNL